MVFANAYKSSLTILGAIGDNWSLTRKPLRAGGTNTNSLDRKINAFYLAWDVALKFEKNIILSLGRKILSGNEQLDGNGENKAFALLYGTNHKLNDVWIIFTMGIMKANHQAPIYI